MHNRVGTGVQSRELTLRDGAVLVPLVLVILFFAFYPQLGLHRSEASTKAAIAPARAVLTAPKGLAAQASQEAGASAEPQGPARTTTVQGSEPVETGSASETEAQTEESSAHEDAGSAR
jgi:hypothetical protein